MQLYKHKSHIMSKLPVSVIEYKLHNCGLMLYYFYLLPPRGKTLL